MQILQKIWNVLKLAIRYGLLIEIILLAGYFWLIERMIGGISRHPKAALGGINPIGAATIVRWWASGSIWLLSRGRRGLGDYLQTHHPLVYQRIYRLFQ